MKTYEDAIREYTCNLAVNESRILLDRDSSSFIGIAHKCSTEKVNAFKPNANFSEISFSREINSFIYKFIPADDVNDEHAIIVKIPCNKNTRDALKNVANGNGTFELYIANEKMNILRCFPVYTSCTSQSVLKKVLESI